MRATLGTVLPPAHVLAAHACGLSGLRGSRGRSAISYRLLDPHRPTHRSRHAQREEERTGVEVGPAQAPDAHAHTASHWSLPCIAERARPNPTNALALAGRAHRRPSTPHVTAHTHTKRERERAREASTRGRVQTSQSPRRAPGTYVLAAFTARGTETPTPNRPPNALLEYRNLDI